MSQLHLSIHGVSPSLLRVLSDNRVDGRHFVVYKVFTMNLFLQCYREAQQHIRHARGDDDGGFPNVAPARRPSKALDGGCPFTTVRLRRKNDFLRTARCYCGFAFYLGVSSGVRAMHWASTCQE